MQIWIIIHHKPEKILDRRWKKHIPITGGKHATKQRCDDFLSMMQTLNVKKKHTSGPSFRDLENYLKLLKTPINVRWGIRCTIRRLISAQKCSVVQYRLSSFLHSPHPGLYDLFGIGDQGRTMPVCSCVPIPLGCILRTEAVDQTARKSSLLNITPSTEMLYYNIEHYISF